MPVDHYENFPVASILLPRRLVPAVEAIYAFARSADDLAEAIRLGQAWRALTAPRPEPETSAAEPDAAPGASDSTRAPLALRPPDKPKRRRKR